MFVPDVDVDRTIIVLSLATALTLAGQLSPRAQDLNLARFAQDNS
jgi:hypothetical protein